jgi:hypothetical protein
MRFEDDVLAISIKSVLRIVLHARSAPALPRDKIAAAGEPSPFVCVGETCSLPVRMAVSTHVSLRACMES